jgi:acid phosphatase type 7
MNLRVTAALVVGATALTLAVSVNSATQGDAAEDGAAVLWAVGDVCDDDNAAQDCADVGELIADDPTRDALLMLGDGQYDRGTLSEYRTWYDAKMGHLNGITRPVPGNHEYASGSAVGYFSYFGARAGDPTKGYYSFTINGWRVIALNTTCGKVPGGCAYTGPQSLWLRDQLAMPERCEVVFGHHPYISDGEYYPGIGGMKSFFRRAITGRAELFLSGHDHNYQRFAPRDLTRSTSSTGVPQIVVGNGGSSLYGFQANRTVARNASTFGALRLVLDDSSYRGQMRSIAGATLDTFSGSCR